jgi:hypothetical protein
MGVKGAAINPSRCSDLMYFCLKIENMIFKKTGNRIIPGAKLKQLRDRNIQRTEATRIVNRYVISV